MIASDRVRGGVDIGPLGVGLLRNRLNRSFQVLMSSMYYPSWNPLKTFCKRDVYFDTFLVQRVIFDYRYVKVRRVQ